MKNSIILIATVVLVSCTGSEKSFPRQNLKFKNDTSQKIDVNCYLQNELKYSEEINANEYGTDYVVIQAPQFFNFSGVCDSISIKFSSNEGYLCSFNHNSKCFPSKASPLNGTENDFIKEGNTYIYDITEEDYQNAFDL
jgi:hypothetical protein